MKAKRRVKTKPKTRAVDQYSKFVLKDEIKYAHSSLNDTLMRLKKRDKVYRMIRKMAFPCSVRFETYSTSVEFYPPKGGWKDKTQFHKTLASLVRQFGVKMKRSFEEYNGKYLWSARTEKGLDVKLYGAVKPDNCTIIPYQDTITCYKSVCVGDDSEVIVA